MAEEDGEARARKGHAKRKHELEAPRKDSSNSLPPGFTRCSQCQKVVHGSSKVCKGCNARLQSSQERPAESDSSADPPIPRPQQKKAKRVVQLESSSSEDSESDAEPALVRSPPSAPRGRPLPGLQALLQDGETNDQPAVAWAKGEKPMMEVPARSDVWWYVEVVQAAAGELRVAYPDPEDQDVIKREWVSRRSSRLWRGSMSKSAWKYLGREFGKGAWRPKAPQGPRKGAGKRGRKPRGARSQCGTTTQGTTAGAGSSGVMGEEPDVASPRKQLQRRRGQGPDSDGEVSDQSLAALKGSSRRKDTALDPLASWFANHFVALQERGLLDCEFAKGCPEAGWLPPPGALFSSAPQAPGPPDAAPSGRAPPSPEAESNASGLKELVSRPAGQSQGSAAAAQAAASKRAKEGGDQRSKGSHDGGSTPAPRLSSAFQGRQNPAAASIARVSSGGADLSEGGAASLRRSEAGVPVQQSLGQKQSGNGHVSSAGAGCPSDVKRGVPKPSANSKGTAVRGAQPGRELGGVSGSAAERGKPQKGSDPGPKSAAKPSPAGSTKVQAPLNSARSKLGMGTGRSDGGGGRSEASKGRSDAGGGRTDGGGKTVIPSGSSKKQQHLPSRPSIDSAPLGSALAGRLARVLVPRPDDEQPGGAVDCLMPSPRNGLHASRGPAKPSESSPASDSHAGVQERSKNADPWKGSHLGAPRAKGGHGQGPSRMPPDVNGKVLKRT